MTPIRRLVAGAVLAAGTLIAAGAAFSTANAADTAPAPQAGPAGHPGWHGHHRGHGFLYSKLGLSDDQKAQIKSIHEAAKPQMQSLFQQMQANSAKLKTLSPADPNYMATVQEVSQANAPLQAQLHVQRLGVEHEIFNKVLNSSQQTQLQQLKLQMQERMQQHMQSRGAPTGT